MRRFDRSFLEPKPLSVKIDVDAVCSAVTAVFAGFNRVLAELVEQQREASNRRMLGDEVYESLYHQPGSTRWQTVYTDQLKPLSNTCPPPRPAGAHDAEEHTRADALRP